MISKGEYTAHEDDLNGYLENIYLQLLSKWAYS